MKTLFAIAAAVVLVAEAALGQPAEKIVNAFGTIPQIQQYPWPTANNVVAVQGLTTAGDGNGGIFAYDPTSNVSTNSTNVFASRVVPGRIIRQFGGTSSTGTGNLTVTGSANVGDLLSASDTSGTAGVWSAPYFAPNDYDLIGFGFTNYLAWNTNLSTGLMLPYAIQVIGSTNIEAGSTSGSGYTLLPANQDIATPENGGLDITAVMRTNQALPDGLLGGILVLNPVLQSASPLGPDQAYVYITPQNGQVSGQALKTNELILGVSVDFTQPFNFSVASAGYNGDGFNGSLAKVGINTNLATAWLEVVGGDSSLTSGRPLQKWSHVDGTSVASVDYDGLSHATGFGSLAADAPITIASGGWTNSLGKNAQVSADGTGLTYTVYNNAGTAVYTNAATVTHFDATLQPGGKVLITAGSGISGRAWPW